MIPESLRALLDSPLSVEELKESINHLANNKTPGLDGLPNEFYKAFAELLCPFILLVWQESLSFGALPLIHKKGVKDEINNWRPITCLNSVYKILALALSRRISPILDSVILSKQKGFIKGRYILDAITSLWEGADFALEESIDFLFFKIDFDKAYDRIEWDFVLQSLHDLGLGRNFIKQVHALFGNARARIAINGTLSPPIDLKRSIRQGCPLAPLIFVIPVDSLGWLVVDFMDKGKIKGIKIPGANKDLCMQNFADDTNALILNDPSSVEHLWKALNLFCLASGSDQPFENWGLVFFWHLACSYSKLWL